MQREALPMAHQPHVQEPAPVAAKPVLLIVDDEPTNVRLLNDIFAGEYKVLVATRGEQALNLCASAQPDLLLLDVLMPGMDGYAVCERLKASELTRDIPVIFVTSNTDPQSETHALEVGGADFITKPVNASVVKSRVKAQVTLRQQQVELKRTIESLRISQAHALAANNAANEFFSAVSHELRTPLTSILGFADLLQDRLSDPKLKKGAQLIHAAAEHLHQLLTEILDLAKLEAGAMPIVAAPVPLHRLLGDVSDMFQITAEHKSLGLALRIGPDVPHMVMLDGLRLKQILTNLLSNAFKFTTAGEVSIEASVKEGRLTIGVRDTGPGIAADLHERIFEKFKQASADVAQSHGGTGLGLALSRGLAERMGGTLNVESTPGAGATFWLTAPLEVSDAPH